MSQEQNGRPVPPSGPVPPYRRDADVGYASYQAQASAKKSRGWIVAIVVAVVCCFLVIGSLWSCSSTLMSAVDSSSGALAVTSDSVGVIDIDGEIQYDGSTCSPEGLKEQLDLAAGNPRIVAVVLRVNSGGGTATAGEEMSTYVKQFREQTGKPVVVSSASINASAAYEISSQADYIFTAKTTAIGAIGTALQLIDYSELLDMLGISIENITSSESKDSSYGTRSLTEEERAYYQNQVDAINEVFLDFVSEGRGMDRADVEKLATGMTFTGEEAVANGLADAIGTEQDALDYASELAGVDASSVESVSLSPVSSDDLSLLLDLMASGKSDINSEELANAIEELSEHGAFAH